MLGIVVVLVVLVAALGAAARWTRWSVARRGGTPPVAGGTPPVAGGTPPVAGPKPLAAGSPRRLPLLTAALATVGAVLVLAGAAVAVGRQWHHLTTTGRLLVLAGVALLFLVVGVVLRRSDVAGVTDASWVVSVAGFAGALGVVTEYWDTPERTAALVVAAPATGYAALLWSVHRHAAQQAVLYAGVLVTATAAVERAVTDPSSWMVVLPVWGIAVAWAVAGWRRRLAPWYVAVPLGLLVALVAPTGVEAPSGLRFGLGIATAAAVMALGAVCAFTPGLVLGSVALLGYVIGAVSYYVGRSLGVAATLAIAGLLVLGFAVAAMRFSQRRQPPGRQPPGRQPPGRQPPGRRPPGPPPGPPPVAGEEVAGPGRGGR